MDRIATLSELRKYLENGLTLEQVIKEVERYHGICKVFDATAEQLPGMKFRYFVIQLDPKNQPITKLAKGANL